MVRFDQRHARFHGAGDDGFQVCAFELELDLAPRDARHVQQVVDQVHHLIDLPLHHVAHARHGGGLVGGQAHDLQAVADRCQRIAQFVRQGGQEFRLAPVHLGQIVGQLAQLLFRALALADVAEQHRQQGAAGAAEARRKNFEPAFHGHGFVFVAHGLARLDDLVVQVEPVLVMVGHEAADGLADGIVEARLLDEGGVAFQVAEVHGTALLVVQHFNDAKGLVHQLDQSAIAFLAAP
ncbi:hypothetical protein JAB2_23880 [Janthinobacterium sp. HH100]|nr:hypothetical protein JAB2_23880 [Janthinobacterium sp. HH100]